MQGTKDQFCNDADLHALRSVEPCAARAHVVAFLLSTLLRSQVSSSLTISESFSPWLDKI
jgi:hypothetical protein